MTRPRIAPYGTWRSPVTPALITGTQVGLAGPWLDGGGVAYWTESRPLEGGRVTLVRRQPDGRVEEVTPAPFNLRTRVHEYGGRAYAALGGVVVVVEFRDQRLHRVGLGAPVPLTPESGALLRYAEPVLDLPRRRALAVREDHRGGGEPRNELVAVPLEGDGGGGEPHEGVVLDGAHDFVAYPRPSPDGRLLAWIAWDHPDMPWDGTTLWVAELDARGLPAGPPRLVAGGREESVVQPEWSPDGTLHFLSDRDGGWWNLHRWRGGRAEPVCPMEAELGGPLWQLGARWYELLDDATAVGVVARPGGAELARIDLRAGTAAPLPLPFVEYAGLSAAGGRLLVQALAADAPGTLLLLDPATGRREALATTGELPVAASAFARPEPVSFPSADGRTAHALFYAPSSPDHAAPAGELPPLVVRSHGGPTGRASPALNLQVQYWTSRGFAVVDVDYGGSTGYGRAYRRLLDGAWGIVDVEDCVAAARHLVATGRADPARVAIRGGSAGGYTTLCALTFHGHAFAAGASSYGVGDLETLARDTHKFESRYLDRLVGPWPEAAATYRARSPLHHVDRLARPVIFLQGLDDKVVPPNQAEQMVAALRAKGLPVAYLAFAGEGHGFRRAETIEAALEAERAFLCRVLGIDPAEEPLRPLEIENLPD
jgi:dipeptidyl aminopeptidase/acylaminoacyl peptidase